MQRLSFVGPLLILTGCATAPPPTLSELPAVESYCLTAQRLVTRTDQAMRLIVHDDFMAFVKSKAVIEGPEIQQINWATDDGKVYGISCKLKSADHLNLTFGAGTAGPDGLCQDMNRAVYKLLAQEIPPAKMVYPQPIFEPRETVFNKDEPGRTGPDWLAPYKATWVDDTGRLHIRSKGFQVNFSDPQFAAAPARFRGVHYCHFLAPNYLSALLRGKAEPGLEIGGLVDRTSGTGH